MLRLAVYLGISSYCPDEQPATDESVQDSCAYDKRDFNGAM